MRKHFLDFLLLYQARTRYPNYVYIILLHYVHVIMYYVYIILLYYVHVIMYYVYIILLYYVHVIMYYVYIILYNNCPFCN